MAVDQILRNLMEMQLVRVIGRSELPGRPWMYGTTQKFMEHFGLKSLDDLPGTDELRRMEAEQQALRATKAAEAAADEAEEPTEVEAAEDAEGEGEEGSFEREGMTEEEIVGADDSEGEEDEFADEEEDEFDDEDDDEFDEDDEDDEEDEE